MQKITCILFCILSSTITFAQIPGNFSGGFESNSQLLQDDTGINFKAPEDRFRANNYFLLNYNYDKFSAGLQYESYLPAPLLGYSPDLEGNGIATYFLNFKHENLDITAGYFYEQFGSGLVLRSWEDRQLGINNAIKGVRIKFAPVDFINLTGLYGEQRVGFETSDGTIHGLDANMDLSGILNVADLFMDLGGSYVGRFQNTFGNENIPSFVNAFSGRMDISYKNIYAGFEAIHKEPDVLVNEGVITNNSNSYKGSALLVNMGYGFSGFGVNAQMRRIENLSFYADRLAEGNQYNQQVINFIPALTKQHDYLLSNIYVYNPQSRLVIQEFQQQAGEIGAQIDMFYTIKKDTPLGGKYGTKLDFNFSYWAGLDTTFDVENNGYTSQFIGDGGDRFFREVSLEVRKRWTENLSAIYTASDVIIDKGITDGSPLGFQDIRAQIGVAEHTYRLGSGRSVRFELQHLWTQDDRNNWAGSVIEYNFSSNFAVYLADSWNYGGEGADKIHYYNAGGSFTKGRTRVAMNYGRQRGGLICVGGVCRFVPENTGITLNVSVAF